MSTSRVSDCLGADIGAQYISATEYYSKLHHSLYSELLSSGVLVSMSCSMEGLQQKDVSQNYTSPQGMNQVVKYYLQQSGADLRLQRHVTAVTRSGACWEVEFVEGDRMEDRKLDTFDAVVLTMPVPQILQLSGDVSHLLSEHQVALLDQVQYSSRFALVLFFGKDLVLDLDYGLKYVSDSPCIRYISVEHHKRNTDLEDLGACMVVHSSVSFGREHLEKTLREVQPIIIQELYRLLPQLPQPISIKTHKWRFSQVLTAVPGCPGHMLVQERPLLLLGGDAFTHSNFDGCAESALSMLTEITKRLDPDLD